MWGAARRGGRLLYPDGRVGDGHGDAVPLQRNFRGVTLGCVVEDAEGQPGDGGNHSDPANIARDAPDRSIVLQDSPLPEQHAPIVFTAAKKRERLIAGVGHVGAYIRKVFEKPERRKGKSGSFTSKEEIRRAEERHEELPKGSAKNHYGFAKPTEKQVPALVNHQIDVIEEEKPAAFQSGVQEKKGIETNPANSSGTGNRLPYTEAIFEKRHRLQRSKSRFSRVLKKRCRLSFPAQRGTYFFKKVRKSRFLGQTPPSE
jgi:hypothetical protein